MCAGFALSVLQLGLSSQALAMDCPAATVADPKGVPAGKYPQQYDLAEFESLAKCKLSFKANPDIEKLNKRIRGNPDLPPLEQRIPEDALVVAPYASIGKYGGTFDVMSNATEAGTSDFLAIRHVKPGALLRRPADHRAERGQGLGVERRLHAADLLLSQGPQVVRW